jgi:two-component system, NarL family, nitrate/nitrite response regulator NarL
MSVKVLILEDNPVAREFLSRVLRDSFTDPISIVEAGDLETARAQIALTGPGGLHGTNPFKLMLLDLELPDGNGLDLLAELRQYPATKVVTTLYSDDDHLFPALQCGADGYLLKEDRFDVLVDELRKIVLGQPPLSPAIARRLLSHFRHDAQGQPAKSEPGTAQPTQPAGLSAAPSLTKAPVPIERTIELPHLTPREIEVLTFLSKGFTIKEIANLMGIKWFTVNDHIKSIYRKLNVSSRAEAAVLASKQGLV